MNPDPRYDRGIALFRATEFFEAHEALEDVWRETPAGEDREFLQGLIQLAVSLEHFRRGNPRGALGQWAKAQRRLDGLTSPRGGIDLARLLAEMHAFYEAHDLAGRVADAIADTPRLPLLDARWPAPLRA